MCKNIKNIVASFVVMVVVAGVAFASSTSAEALNFFNSYVKAANSYQPVIASMYAPNAKIIREVLKKDGTTVTRTTERLVRPALDAPERQKVQRRRHTTQQEHACHTGQRAGSNNNNTQQNI